jgi:UDP-N-acetylmuramate dehydrogenase
MFNETTWEERFKGYYKGKTVFGKTMADLTSLGIGGPADILTSPGDPMSLRNLMVVLREEKIPAFPLGGGTNMLVRDGGMEGVVLSLREFGRIEPLEEKDGSIELFVEAGVFLQRLVNFCKEKGYAGIEGLTGIPGTVGGAICGNAGSFGVEMKDVLVSVAVMNSDGRLDRYAASDLGFGYRTSHIRQDDIVLSANMRLKVDEAQAVSRRTEDFFAEKKGRQPISERSAGCVFRNPEGSSAGELIDRAGCKGLRRGGIQVSEVHANFFINAGGGTASDFVALMEEVSSAVCRTSGLTLEPEIRIVGRG